MLVGGKNYSLAVFLCVLNLNFSTCIAIARLFSAFLCKGSRIIIIPLLKLGDIFISSLRISFVVAFEFCGSVMVLGT